jgi:hypothetical protein
VTPFYLSSPSSPRARRSFSDAHPDENKPQAARASGCDSVRDLHRASRGPCASDARLHPTTGDRWTSNARELQPSCGVRDLLVNFDTHGARWPHAACDRLLRFDDGTLHNDQRADLEPRTTL